MKINGKIDLKRKYAEYCPYCFSEKIEEIILISRVSYACKSCGKKTGRLIIIDQKLKFWVDKKKNYWHESVGVFIFNKKNEILLIHRTKFPIGYAIPAGHLDKDELPENGAKREVFEEVGLKLKELKLVSEEDILNDPCRRGADQHNWHLYKAIIGRQKIKINNESESFVWCKKEDALKLNLVALTRHFLEKYF